MELVKAKKIEVVKNENIKKLIIFYILCFFLKTKSINLFLLFFIFLRMII